MSPSTSSRRLAAVLGRVLLVLGAIGLSLAPAGARSLNQTGGGPVVMRIGEALNPGTLSLVRRSIDEAEARSTPLVIELDTPGGNVELMWKIARAIDRAKRDGLQVVAFVDNHALSAGALIALACDLIYMSPQGTIGAALPIVSAPMPMPQAVDEKFLSAFRSEFRAWAEAHGRSGALAEGMVDPKVEVLLIEQDGLERVVTGKEWDDLRAGEQPVRRISTIADSETLVALSANEAQRYRLIDGIAESLEQLVVVKLSMPAASPVRMEATGAEQLAAFLASIAPILMLAGVVFLWMELQAPGIGVPAILAGACFAALLFGRYLTGLAGIEHFVMIGLGLVLLAVELFVVPGTLVAGITGGVLVLLGLVWSQLGPDLPLSYSFDRKLLIQAAYRTVLWMFLGLVASLGLSRLLPHTPLGRILIAQAKDEAETFGTGVGDVAGERATAARVGATGRALTALRPVGKVELEAAPGQEFEALIDGDALEPGARVRVIELRTGRLVVEPAPGSGGAA